jgi:hypothetical protein
MHTYQDSEVAQGAFGVASADIGILQITECGEEGTWLGVRCASGQTEPLWQQHANGIITDTDADSAPNNLNGVMDIDLAASDSDSDLDDVGWEPVATVDAMTSNLQGGLNGGTLVNSKGVKSNQPPGSITPRGTSSVTKGGKEALTSQVNSKTKAPSTAANMTNSSLNASYMYTDIDMDAYVPSLADIDMDAYVPSLAPGERVLQYDDNHNPTGQIATVQNDMYTDVVGGLMQDGGAHTDRSASGGGGHYTAVDSDMYLGEDVNKNSRVGGGSLLTNKGGTFVGNNNNNNKGVSLLPSHASAGGVRAKLTKGPWYNDNNNQEQQGGTLFDKPGYKNITPNNNNTKYSDSDSAAHHSTGKSNNSNSTVVSSTDADTGAPPSLDVASIARKYDQITSEYRNLSSPVNSNARPRSVSPPSRANLSPVNGRGGNNNNPGTGSNKTGPFSPITGKTSSSAAEDSSFPSLSSSADKYMTKTNLSLKIGSNREEGHGSESSPPHSGGKYPPLVSPRNNSYKHNDASPNHLSPHQKPGAANVYPMSATTTAGSPGMKPGSGSPGASYPLTPPEYKNSYTNNKINNARNDAVFNIRSDGQEASPWSPKRNTRSDAVFNLRSDGTESAAARNSPPRNTSGLNLRSLSGVQHSPEIDTPRGHRSPDIHTPRGGHSNVNNNMHSNSNATPEATVQQLAQIVYNKTGGGVDSSFKLDPQLLGDEALDETLSGDSLEELSSDTTVRVCVFVCLCACMCMRMTHSLEELSSDTPRFVCVCVCVYIWMCLCMDETLSCDSLEELGSDTTVCVCIYMCVCIYICVCIYMEETLS